MTQYISIYSHLRAKYILYPSIPIYLRVYPCIPLYVVAPCISMYRFSQLNKLTSAFHVSVLLCIINEGYFENVMTKFMIRGMRKQLTQIVQLQSTSSTGKLRKMARDYQKDKSVI